jgi:endo-1,4-beta-xylanase
MRTLVTCCFLLTVLWSAACHKQATPTATTPSTTTPQAGTEVEPLRDAAASASRLVGAAVQAGYLGDSRYAAVLGRHFNYLTAEYEMKWGATGQASGAENYSAGDAIAAYAQSHGMQLKGHALIWHGSFPTYLSALSPEDFRSAFEQHIRATAGHYRGRVLSWDVVNEAIADDGSGLRDTIFRQKLGDDYIADAFRLAREADSGALLFYNDYGGEGSGSKSNRIYDLVKSLLAQHVPIDGVGLQMHVTATGRPSDASLATNMRRLADLGLLVNISEMDVRIRDVPGSTQSRLDAQRSVYHSIVAVCVAEPRCHAVTFWGFTDAHSWIDSQYGADDPLLFDDQYAAKPAFFGVLDAFYRR